MYRLTYKIFFISNMYTWKSYFLGKKILQTYIHYLFTLKPIDVSPSYATP